MPKRCREVEKIMEHPKYEAKSSNINILAHFWASFLGVLYFANTIVIIHKAVVKWVIGIRLWHMWYMQHQQDEIGFRFSSPWLQKHKTKTGAVLWVCSSFGYRFRSLFFFFVGDGIGIKMHTVYMRQHSQMQYDVHLMLKHFVASNNLLTQEKPQQKSTRHRSLQLSISKFPRRSRGCTATGRKHHKRTMYGK